MEEFKQAIILDVRYTGANMALVSIFCEQNGLKKGIVKVAKKRQAELQKGNVIEYLHLKRSENNLGTFKFNLLEQTFVKYFDDRKAFANLNSISNMLIKYLKEDIPYAQLYDLLISYLNNLNSDDECFVELFRYNMLKELGVTLDINDYLKEDKQDASPAYYVSPKSVRVVSKAKGLPYNDRLLIIPKIIGGVECINQADLLHKINNLLEKRLW